MRVVKFLFTCILQVPNSKWMLTDTVKVCSRLRRREHTVLHLGGFIVENGGQTPPHARRWTICLLVPKCPINFGNKRQCKKSEGIIIQGLEKSITQPPLLLPASPLNTTAVHPGSAQQPPRTGGLWWQEASADLASHLHHPVLTTLPSRGITCCCLAQPGSGLYTVPSWANCCPSFPSPAVFSPSSSQSLWPLCAYAPSPAATLGCNYSWTHLSLPGIFWKHSTGFNPPVPSFLSSWYNSGWMKNGWVDE